MIHYKFIYLERETKFSCTENITDIIKLFGICNIVKGGNYDSTKYRSNHSWIIVYVETTPFMLSIPVEKLQSTIAPHLPPTSPSTLDFFVTR